MRPLVYLIYLIFFLSGFAALVYEISWSRQLGLLFGHTVHAASVVLASYFSGMAIGYALGARWSSRINPLAGYAIAELVVAGWAFAIPLLLDVSETAAVAPWLSHSSFFWQTSARVVFSFLLLMPATIALGVTLPMMATWLASESGGMARPQNASRVALAYAINTAGALCGVVVATMVLLVLVGVTGSSYCAALFSIAAAVIALLIARATGGTAPEKLVAGPKNRAPLVSQLTLLAALSGFSTLALQVLYTRMFSLVFHNSTYTFGIVVTVFLGALTLGSVLASWVTRRLDIAALKQATAWALAAGAIYTVASISFFVELTGLDYFSYGDSFASYMTAATALVALMVGPGITLFGMVLPLAWRLAAVPNQADGGAHTGSVVGRLTSVNTIAAAVGALAASFLLLPLFGLWAAAVAVAGVVFMVGFSWLNTPTFPTAKYIAAAMMLVLSMLALNSPTESGNARSGNERTLRRWNSAYGWIDVVQQGDSDVLKIRQNLHYRFGKTGNNAREYRQAHIPLLLHDHPKRVMFMGLGTGLTAGGAVPHAEVKQVVVAELIPEVIEATRMLKRFNFNIIDHPKSTVVADDARHALLASDATFDVIVSDLFVPWESQSGYLYTVEHYQTAASRLNEDGLFCQWLPMYQVGTEEFEMIANSLASVFPKVTLWWGKMSGSRSPIIALIGSKTMIEIDTKKLQPRLEKLAVAMGSSDPSIASCELLLDHYVGDWEISPSAVLNTDEFPRVEFSTPVSNRDRKMIHSHTFEEYYEDVLSKLKMQAVKIDGQLLEDPEQQRARQRIFLFGGE